MPRNYQRKAPDRKNITQALIDRAKALIAAGTSKRRAAEQVGINECTLRKRLKLNNTPLNLGRFKPTFDEKQEHEFGIHCKQMDNMFYGVTINDLRRLAYEYAEANKIEHRFNHSSKMAGRDWVEGFLKRNPSLCLRQSAPTSLARAIGFNKTQVERFYKNLKDVYDRYKFRPNRIYNMDETGMSTVPKKTPKVITTKGKKVVGKIVSADRGITVTAMLCMNVTGHYVPPAFIYPRKRPRPGLLDGSPLQSICMVSDSGFVNTDLFLDWMHHFKDFTHPSAEDPVLLILDNHSSHISLKATKFAREHHIVMLTLPPHGSHKLQPLDVAVHSPLKTKYAIECEKWMNQHPGRGITQYQVAGLFHEAFKHVASVANAEAGFKATGIYPYADDLFDETDFAPSAVTDQRPSSSDIQEEAIENAPNQEVSVGHSPLAAIHEHQPEPVPVVANISSTDVTTKEITHLPSKNITTQDEDATDIENEVEIEEFHISPSLLYRNNSFDLDKPEHDNENNLPLQNLSLAVENDQIIEKQTDQELSKQTTPSTTNNRAMKEIHEDTVTANEVLRKPLVTVAQISPLPYMKEKKKKTRSSLKSEIITSSPYKQQLDKKEEEKKAKNKKLPTLKPLMSKFESQPPKLKQKKKSKPKVKQTISKSQPGPSGLNKHGKQKEKDPVYCPICGEMYVDPPEEEWILCFGCLKWFHEDCTAFETGDFYCDFCQRD